MLRSMTGQGLSHRDGPLGTFTVEFRTVNNRGFKLVQRLGDSLGRFEPRIEALVRNAVRRGSIQLNANWQRPDCVGRYRIDTQVVQSYFVQLEQLRDQLASRDQRVPGSRLDTHSPATIDLARLASLPGAIAEAAGSDEDDEAVWENLSAAIFTGLENLERMRLSEGEAMQRQLLVDLHGLEQSLAEIERLAPRVAEGYRDRLRNKIEVLMRREGLQVETPDLLREVQIFADRSDISEEITRLHSHSELFREAVAADESSGRKLDFVIQEMFRETNTIGSKALDADIARHVVDMKCGLERMRELVQNIE